MTGSDLETRSGEASLDLEEMISAMPTDGGMSVAVLTGGAAEWHTDIPSDRNCLWEVTSGELKLVEEYEAQNMGDRKTFSDFLQRGTELFPAERYALILWDHGGGPLSGVCFDERFDMDALCLEEIEDGLRDSPFARQKLLFIGFDACLMASIETACAIAPYAEVMIASQEPEPGAGWDYAFLPELAQVTDGEEAGEVLIRTYAASQTESLSPISLSCLDLSRAEEVEQEIDRLFGSLADSISEDTYSMLAQCRVSSRTLGNASFSEWDLADLIDLAKELEKQGSADVTRLLEETERMILRNHSTEKNENGVSIYAPFDNKVRYSQPWSDRYRKMNFAKGYRIYVENFAKIWLGEEQVDWRNQEEAETERERNTVNISLLLEEELAENTAYARLLVLQTGFGPEDEYSLIYASEQMQPRNGILRATYSGEALYLMNEQNEVVDGPMEPYPLEDGIALYAVMEDVFWKRESAYLIWRQQADGTYSLTGIEIYNRELEMFMPSSRKPMKGDVFSIGGYVKRNPGMDTAFRDWPWGNTILCCIVPYTEGTQWKLQYLPMYSEYDRVAVFEIVDLQGNIHLSEMIQLDNPDKTSLSVPDQTAEDGELKLTLKEASLLTGSYPALELELDLLGYTDELYLQTILLNHTAISSVSHRYDIRMEDPTEQAVKVTIPATDLQKAGVRQIETLSLVFSNGDELKTFDFDFPVDTGMIALEEETAGEPLFIGEKDGVTFEILTMEQDVYGNLIGRIHITNQSGESKCFENFMYAGLNGEIKLNAYIETEGISLSVIPDGYELQSNYKIYTQTYEDGARQEIVDINPAEIRQIHLELDGQDFKPLFDVELVRQKDT